MATRSLGNLTVDLLLKQSGWQEGWTQAERDADRAQRKIEADARRAQKAMAAEARSAASTTQAAWSAAAKSAGDDMTRLSGLTQRQYTAAMRNVPAQITDIVVSLQGGQAPLTVLLQQGGQLKDMFGGIVPALGALGKGLLATINPITALGAGAVALGAGFIAGRKEMQSFVVALETTGYSSGATKDSLNGMAAAMGDLGDATRGRAAQALAAFATSAGVGSDRLQQYTQTALEWEKATGQAAEEVAKNFKKIADDPVKGIRELDKSMNFLTATTYAQITALQKAGDTTGAARVAQDAYDEATKNAAKNITENLGAVERAWMGIVNGSKWALDAIKDVGRETAQVERLAKVVKEIAFLQKEGIEFDSSKSFASLTVPQQRLAALKAEEVQLQKNVVAETNSAKAREQTRSVEEARMDLADEAAKYADKQTLKTQELAAAEIKYGAAARENAEAAKQYAAVRAGIEEKYKETPKSTQTRATEGSYQTLLKNVREAIAAFELEAQQVDKLTESQKLKIQYDELESVSKKTVTQQTRDQIAAELQRLEIAEKTNAATSYVKDLKQQTEAYKEITTLQKLENDLAAGRVVLSGEMLEAATQYAGILDQRVALEKRLQELAKETARLNDMASDNSKLREEIELLGLNEVQQAAINAQRLEAQILVKEQHLAEVARRDDLTETHSIEQANLQYEIDLLRERLALTSEKASRTMSVKSAEESRKAWQSSVDSITKSLTDQLMAGGKSFGDYLKNLARTLIFRPIIENVVNSVLGPLMGGSGGGGMNLGSLFGGTGSGINQLIYGKVGQSIGLSSVGAGGMGPPAATAAGSAMSSVAAFAPYAAMIIAGMQMSGEAYDEGYRLGHSDYAKMWTATAGIAPPTLSIDTQLLESLGLSGKTANMITGASLWAKYGARLGLVATPHTGAGAIYANGDVQEGRGIYNRETFGMGDPREYAESAQAAISSVAAQIGVTLDAVAVTFGKKAGFSVATAFADDISKDGAWGSLKITDDLGKVLVDWGADPQSKWAPREFANGEEGYKQYLAAVEADLLSAVQAMDLPGWAEDLFATAEGIDGLTAALNAAGVVIDAFKQLGDTMSMFAGISGELQTSLIKASGGMDALVKNANSFYQNFYSDDEREGITRRQLQDQMTGLGLGQFDFGSEDARAAFRSLVEGQMALAALGDEKAAAAVAALLGMSDAIASVTVDAEEAAKAIADAAAVARQQAIDAAWMNFEAASERELAYWSEIQSKAAEAISALTPIIATLRSNAADLFAEVSGAAAQQAVNGQLYVAEALRSVRAGGSLTQFDGLSDAITSARAGMTTDQFGTEFEYLRAIVGFANDLSELGDLGDEQLSTEERIYKAAQAQIDLLDEQLIVLRKMLDGTDKLIDLSLTANDAAARVIALLTPDEEIELSTNPTAAPGTEPVWGGSGGGAAASPKYQRPTGSFGGNTTYGVPGASEAAYLDTLYAGYHAFDNTGDTAGLAAWITSNKVSVDSMSALSGFWAADWEKFYAQMGIPAFAVGTNRVPQDMLAFVHKDEAIVPAAYNPALGGDSVAAAPMAQLIEDGRAQAAAILSRLSTIANTITQWDADGIPEEREVSRV